MENVRAEILNTGSDLMTAAQIVINAPSGRIFEFLAHPSKHSLFDGSGTVQKVSLDLIDSILVPNLGCQ